MFKQFLAVSAANLVRSTAFGRGAATVDLLTPGETSGAIPANFRVVDVFFDVATTDVWTAAGIRALSEHGATIAYVDQDLNTPGVQPGLFNPGVANKFMSSLSKPRGRDANARFMNAGAAAAGEWDPPGATPTTSPTEFNVAYFASPPETPGSLSADGYIARITVDISSVADAPADYGMWAATPLAAVPSSATVVLRSVGVNQPGGTATATFDVPMLNQTNWALWFVVPEPTSLALLALGSLAHCLNRRR